jgi:hypothetical protein
MWYFSSHIFESKKYATFLNFIFRAFWRGPFRDLASPLDP